MNTQKIEYQDADELLEGYYACDPSIKGNKPAVLIVHDWSGRNEFANQKAEQLAKLGYVGFAIDMYGKDKLGETEAEKKALMQPLIKDRNILRNRILAAFNTVKDLPQVDISRIAVIGFCFGGLCALDLARSGAELKGAISFHGMLNKPENLKDEKIKAKILVLHGHDDPSVNPDEVLAFEKEMTKAKVDWQVHVYGGVMHGFTNPKADNPKAGIMYDKDAAKRSNTAMVNFLNEIFNPQF